MTQTVLLCVWLGPSLLLYFCGKVRFFSSVFLWPVWVFFIVAASLTVFITDGSTGLKAYWRYLCGGSI